MSLPPEFRWLDPMLDVLVDEFLSRQAEEDAATLDRADTTALQAAA